MRNVSRWALNRVLENVFGNGCLCVLSSGACLEGCEFSHSHTLLLSPGGRMLPLPHTASQISQGSWKKIRQTEHRGTMLAITHSWMDVLRMKPATIRTGFRENSREKSESHGHEPIMSVKRVCIILACQWGSTGNGMVNSGQQRFSERKTASPCR